jgi:hypothetical protein
MDIGDVERSFRVLRLMALAMVENLKTQKRRRD